MNYAELTVQCPQGEVAEILIARLSEAGFESFTETTDGFLAYIAEGLLDGTQTALLDPYGEQGVNYSLRIIPDQNWNEVWESSFEPVVIDDLCCIRAPFHPAPQGIRYDLVIEPKMSFGTGHHETTSMMVRLIGSAQLAGKRVLDMGCGTAVLAILACRMGAAEVTAIDNDEWAYHNSLENIARNGCQMIRVFEGDAAILLNQARGPFDLVLANINRNILLRDIPAYAAVMSAGAHLMLSGFYTADRPGILDVAAQFSLQEVRSLVLNDWMALELIKA